MFVESLDSAFENVCELDLVFHFDEVRASQGIRAVPCSRSDPFPRRHITSSPRSYRADSSSKQTGPRSTVPVSAPPDVSPHTTEQRTRIRSAAYTSLSARGRAGTEGVVCVCQPAVAWWRWSCGFTQCWAADTLRVAYGQACRSWCQVAQSYPKITTPNAHDPACAILVL